ncbi:hypothetical protein TNCV_3475281 [Trichonephila clavipes]|nr:hypothetical protein TNCV_3475281 [Trichonephila clavipes]
MSESIAPRKTDITGSHPYSALDKYPVGGSHRDTQDWTPGIKDSLCKTTAEFAWKFFFQTQQQGHEQAEEPLFPYVVLRFKPSSDCT